MLWHKTLSCPCRAGFEDTPVQSENMLMLLMLLLCHTLSLCLSLCLSRCLSLWCEFEHDWTAPKQYESQELVVLWWFPPFCNLAGAETDAQMSMIKPWEHIMWRCCPSRIYSSMNVHDVFWNAKHRLIMLNQLSSKQEAAFSFANGLVLQTNLQTPVAASSGSVPRMIAVWHWQ